MQRDELLDLWLEHHNEKYINYSYSQNEPRYYTKKFFLYSYNFFKIFDNEFQDYLERYLHIFLRDPSNDYYGYRSPNDPKKGSDNSLEWTIIFEITRLIGFPFNTSAKEKMLKNAIKFVIEAESSLELNYHDLMVCAAVEFWPKHFGGYRENLIEWIKASINCNSSPHKLIAYLRVVKGYSEHNYLKDKIITILSDWIKNPEDTSRRQILIWARLVIHLHRCCDFSDLEMKSQIKANFFACLEDIHQIEWHNLPIIAEALYLLSDDPERLKIRERISRRLVPSIFFKLKDIFYFLDDGVELPEMQDEIERVKEKCQPHPTKELCLKCMENPQGECWIRVLSKITHSKPQLHGGFEVADVVIYTLNRGIYFVIKACPIEKQKGEGDVLYRQCTQLFTNENALVIYWNAFETHPMVIENIRRNANSMKTKPCFEVIDKKYIRQIYDIYKKILNRENLYTLH